MAHRYFLVYFIFTCCTAAGQSQKYALMGLKVHLKGDITGQPDEILWKHNGNKVVELSGNQEQVYGMFKNRIALNEHTAELDITDLRYEDSGEYVLEAYKSNELSTSTFQLEVIDKVVKPTISCEMNEGSSSDISGTQATLMCSAESRHRSLMKFEWSSRVNVHPGPNLTISLGEKHDDEVYSCTVSNPLSSETATFTAKDCYPGKSSSTALMVTVIILAIILLAMFLGIGFCKLRHKACFAKGNQKTVETPDRPEGSGNNTARDDEEIPLLQGDPVADQHREPAEENVPRCDPSHSEKGNEPQPAGVSGNSSDNIQSDLDSFTASELQVFPGYVKNMKQRFETKDSGQPTPQKLTANTPPNLNNLASSIKGDPVADQQREPAEENVPQCDPSHSERENEPDPAGVLGDSSQNTQSYLDSSTDPEPQEAENETDEEAKSPANDVSPPAAQSHLPLIQSSPNMAPKDNAGEHKEEPDKPVSQDENESNGVGDVEEKDDEEDRNRNADTFQQSPGTAHADSNPEEEGQTRHDSRGQSDKSTADEGYVKNMKQKFEPKDSGQPTPQKPRGDPVADQHRESAEENVPRCDPSHSEKGNESQPAGVSGDSSENIQSDLDSSAPEPQGESNKSDDTEEKHPSTVSEENSPETTLHKQDSGVRQGETHTGEDYQQEPDKPDEEDKNESDDVGEGEQKDEEETSKLPQSATPTKPDNINTSADSAHADSNPEEEVEVSYDSGDSGRQSDKSTADAGKVSVSGSEKKTDEAAQLRSPLTKNSPNMAPDDTASEHKKTSD